MELLVQEVKSGVSLRKSPRSSTQIWCHLLTVNASNNFSHIPVFSALFSSFYCLRFDLHYITYTGTLVLWLQDWCPPTEPAPNNHVRQSMETNFNLLFQFSRYFGSDLRYTWMDALLQTQKSENSVGEVGGLSWGMARALILSQRSSQRRNRRLSLISLLRCSLRKSSSDVWSFISNFSVCVDSLLLSSLWSCIIYLFGRYCICSGRMWRSESVRPRAAPEWQLCVCRAFFFEVTENMLICGFERWQTISLCEVDRVDADLMIPEGKLGWCGSCGGETDKSRIWIECSR